MRAGKARAGEHTFAHRQPTFNPSWRKPKPLTLWGRIKKWLNTP